ncbi:hypothetical protein QLX08_002057 [Tetragonisca angustula]|uniref:TIL domain-containing protein n=1 Tax=Tetragonisca angustula TaxID=166442 RepID=A0AAW1ACE1_9HYME
MSRFLLVVFAILATFSVLILADCPPNEVWNDCGTACPPSCKDPNPEVCTLQCVQGCECAPNYLRNDQDKCVLQRNC